MNYSVKYHSNKQSKFSLIILKSFVVAMLTLLTSLLSAQSDFRYTRSEPYFSEGVSGIATTDNGFVAAANVDMYIRTDTIILDCEDCKIPYDTIIKDIITSDILIMKTDANGNLLWSKQIGDEQNDRCISILETGDKGYVICATDENYSARIIKLNDSGSVVWESKLENHTPQQIIEINGNILVLGTKSHALNDADVYAQKLSSNGNQLWIKYYGQSGSDPHLTGMYQESFKTACKGPYDNIFIVGSKQNDFIWYDIDTDGILLSSGNFGDQGGEDAISIALTEDLNYLLLFNYSAIPVYSTQPRVIKLNPSGEILWEIGYFDNKHYDKAVSLQANTDGGFLITGLQNANIPSLSAMFNLKVNANGIPSWIDNINFTDTNYARPSLATLISQNQIFETGTNTSGKFTFAKRQISNTNNTVDFDLVTRTGISSEKKQIYSLYPNPASNFITISKEFTGNADFIIYNPEGKKMLNVKLSSNKTAIPISLLNNGVYIFRIINDTESFTGKLIINKN